MPLQVPLSQEKQLEKKARPDKLALGGDGGFQLEEDKYEVEKTQALTVLPEGVEIPLPCPELPEIVLSAIKGVMVGYCIPLQRVSCTPHCCPEVVRLLVALSAAAIYPFITHRQLHRRMHTVLETTLLT